MAVLSKDIIEGHSLFPLEPGEIVGRKEIEQGNYARMGIKGNNQTGIGLYPDLLSRHILTIGGIGSGKTNTMNLIVSELRKFATEDDIFIFFDAKGDYLQEFYKPGDYVLSNDLNPPQGTVYWNVYEDILRTPNEQREETIREIATGLFKEDIEHSSAPVFGMGARDVLAAILSMHSNEVETANEKWNHEKLLHFIRSNNVTEIHNYINAEHLKWTRFYLKQSGGSTTQSFIIHLYQTIYKIFSGSFAKEGDFSIRKAISEKGGKAIFLEYDLANGHTLEPIYTILIDLAMKEAMGRTKTKGNVYFVLDEFPLIPKLNYIDNALNFGRSLGVKVIAGIQNMGQVEHRYGPSLGRSILSGFGTVLGFRLFDDASRRFISERHGKNKQLVYVQSSNASKGVQDTIIDGNVIEDWDISQLGLGQCVASLPRGIPFIFWPIEYKK